MHADAHFVKGRSHRICEDYALAGSIGGGPFVVLCDGCSSSPHTDFGARILAHSFKDVLVTLRTVSVTELPMLAVAQAHVRAQSLGLDATSLDCTLLAAWVENGEVHIVQTGDGGIVYKYRDGHMMLRHLEFASGAPFYLSYALDNPRREKYFQEYGSEATITVHRSSDGGKFVPGLCTACLPEDFGEGGLVNDIPLDEVEAVGIFSDGVSTFRHRKNSGRVSAEYVLHKMMSFKTPRGAFIQRRMKRVLKDFEQDGIAPEDDVSLAAIYVG